jgi:hypothetical protein
VKEGTIHNDSELMARDILGSFEMVCELLEEFGFAKEVVEIVSHPNGWIYGSFVDRKGKEVGVCGVWSGSDEKNWAEVWFKRGSSKYVIRVEYTMTCPYCGSKGDYVVRIDDEHYYCYECGATFSW